MLLRPTLDKIASLGWEFEVDPVKTENSEENMEHLLEACQIVLDAIIENCSKVPAAIQVKFVHGLSQICPRKSRR